MNVSWIRPALLGLACLLGGLRPLPAQPAGATPTTLHPLIPIPLPRKPPHYASYFNWLPLNRGNYPDLELLEGRLEPGAFAKVRFGKMRFEGTVDHYRDLVAGYPVRTDGVIPAKGRLEFENGDVYTGQLTRFRRYPYVFVDGEYVVKAEPTRIRFFPVDFNMDGRTYTFGNGDTLTVDRTTEQPGHTYETGTYRYANGATLGLNHSNAAGYEGTFDFRSPEGLTIRGRVHPHSLKPSEIWDFQDPKVGPYRLLFNVFPMGDRLEVFGVAPDRSLPGVPRWVLLDGSKAPLPVRKLRDHVYLLSGNGQDEPSEFLMVGDPWIYRAKAPFTEGKPTGRITAVAFNKFQSSTRFLVSGYLEGFAFDGPCERSREGSKETPITLLAEKGVFKKGFLKGAEGSVIELNEPDSHALYATWNQQHVKRTYPSGVIYVGTTDLHFTPSGEGTVYFPDRSYLVSEAWKQGEVQGKGKYFAAPEAKDFAWMDFSVYWKEARVRKPVVVFSPAPSVFATQPAIPKSTTSCSHCEGTGSVFISCTTCYGKGMRRDITSYNRLTGRVEGTGTVTCSTCQGRGQLRIMGCAPCNGTGKVTR